MNRRTFLVNSGIALCQTALGTACSQAAVLSSANAGSSRATTLSLEDHLKMGVNHLNSLVDDQGRTYFNTFLTQPPEAVTDWPDFVDLPSRYWEDCVLIQSSLGKSVECQERLETVGYDGELIIGPTHHMQLDTPLEDFWAMVDAITGKRELTQGLFTGLGRQRSGGEAKIRTSIEVATLRAQSTMRSGVNL